MVPVYFPYLFILFNIFFFISMRSDPKISILQKKFQLSFDIDFVWGPY